MSQTAGERRDDAWGGQLRNSKLWAASPKQRTSSGVARSSTTQARMWTPEVSAPRELSDYVRGQ